VSVLQGFLVVDKPSGVTSFSMVSLVRRLTGVRRVGHAGTLDPLASGVLPVAVGQATRLIEYLDAGTKVYVARVRFGVTTDTYDADGEAVERRPTDGLTRDAVKAALREFIGDIEQAPPLHSAIKVAGRPLYRYAREGAQVDVKPRVVRIDSIALREFDGESAELEVRCGKGTYIRSLAHDLGQRLGCGAHLAGLVRAESGGFTLADARAPEVLADAAASGRLEELLLASDRAVERWPAAIFGEERTADVLSGRDVRLRPVPAAGRCRAYSTEGDFLGVLEQRAAGSWHPAKVLRLTDSA
jgi:tRNA pseudouridine55 synthase